ncbi:MAG: DUF3180 domain-containing protein [Actinomycetaceae bacterium]|nr:DUF3180 family protein [Arcanobacterium sp.]MDD7687002.1 DUF3180 domain-containing protein [Actinomycetaceae bacterium]MDY5273342.1 DUF3180 domain-containing protein [Arcanobacterium sp.]
MNHGEKHPEKLHLTSAWLLVLIAVIVAAGCFFAVEVWLRAGLAPIVVPLISCVVPLILAVIVGYQGWRVRAYRRGEHAINALTAGRIFVLTQAGSRSGAVLVGGALGVISAYAHAGPSNFLAEQMFRLSLCALASLVLVVVSYQAERWCVVDDSDADSTHSPHTAHPGAGAAA